MMDEWMGRWVDGWSFEADGHFDVFHPFEATQICIFAVLHSLVATVEQGLLFTHELRCSALWGGKANKLQTNMLIFDIQRNTYI